jgi:DNA-binding PadR family transcriptional regulator
MLLQHKMFYGYAEMVVLRILADGPLHPYRLRLELAERSAWHFCPSLGRMYPMLAALEKRGLVGSRMTAGRGVQRRREYRITPAGRRELTQALNHWRSFTRAMASVLAPVGKP